MAKKSQQQGPLSGARVPKSPSGKTHIPTNRKSQAGAAGRKVKGGVKPPKSTGGRG